MSEKTWELKLASGKVVKWEGKDGVDAARRYVDANREEKVQAYREYQYPIYEGIPSIIEP